MAKRHASAKIGMFIQMLEANKGPAGTASAEIYLPMTRSDIGAYVGISPEALHAECRQSPRAVIGMTGFGAERKLSRRILHFRFAPISFSNGSMGSGSF
jgi:hypothetical protein